MYEKSRIGVLGCGKQAAKHITALKRMKARIVLADIQTEHAQQMADEFRVDWVSSVDELFTDSSVDAVDICTPTPSHFALIERALEAGKHFFCEKPLVETYWEAEAIQAALEKTDLVGMVGYLYRFHPAFELVHDLIMDGTVGQPYFATFRLGGRGSHRIWKHKKDKGGGVLNEMMVHMLDLALWFFGPITKTRTLLLDTVLSEREVEGRTIRADAEDLALVYLETDSGVKIICESDLITPSYMNYIEIQATNGSLVTSILDYFPSLVYCREPRGTYQTGNNVLHFPKVNLFEKELLYFLDCITNGSPPNRNTVRESAYLLKLIDAIKKQAEKNDG
jgi:predicted dehydrogenase